MKRRADDTVDAPTPEQVEEVLNERVRPVLRADRGNVRLERVQDDGTVFVSFTGRCAGCPGAEFTLRFLLEPCLKEAFPNLKHVLTVPWHLPYHGG
jgi:Fe-S cluster biogenesis protein NfuA